MAFRATTLNSRSLISMVTCLFTDFAVRILSLQRDASHQRLRQSETELARCPNALQFTYRRTAVQCLGGICGLRCGPDMDSHCQNHDMDRRQSGNICLGALAYGEETVGSDMANLPWVLYCFVVCVAKSQGRWEYVITVFC